MNHHQITEFINSKDVREHLQKIRYEFSTPQAAWVIYHCRRLTMADRHRAWEEVIHDWPDCSMEKRSQLMRIDSFHAFLTDYMALERRNAQEFIDGADCVYRYEYRETYSGNPLYCDGWSEEETLFLNYSACIDHCKRHFGRKADVDKIRISKYRLAPSGPHQFDKAEILLLNRDLEILSINIEYENPADAALASAFDGMCFDIPIPFRRGDILIDCKTCAMPRRTPFVLSYLTTWNSQEMLARGFRERDCPGSMEWGEFDKLAGQILEMGDCTDCHPIGTMINDGNLFEDSFFIVPTDLEYFRGALEGMERQLQVFSCYEKGEIGVELLVNGCSAIRAKEYVEEVYRGCMIPYRKEALECIGMLPADKGK